MKKYIILTILAAIFSTAAMAQVDSVMVADSSICIFEELPGTVTVDQPQSVQDAFDKAIATKVINSLAPKKVKGNFAVRIYSDSGQNARDASAQVLARFARLFPGIPATRTYNSPYFMVTVGQFKDRREAERNLSRIRPSFPRAFVVKR